MANQLGVAKVHSILTLHEQGHSFRQIAGMLGVHRETVARHVHLARGPDAGGSKPATSGQAPTGPGCSKPATTGGAPPGSEDRQIASVAGPAPPGRSGNSQCEPWHDVIVAKLEQGLSAVRIHQDLVAMDPMGAVAVPSYYSVRRFVRQLGAASGNNLPFRRMECAPGQECQVDFGTGAPIVNDQGRSRRRRRPHVLRIVLSHSRKAYSEAVYRQTTEDFIRCLENAFWHFGGVPRTLVLDNLRAAVSKADWFDPDVNPKVQSFCAHYGIVPLPTKPRMPRHKGKIERGIGYVKDNGLKGHVFDSLEAENDHLRHWETHVADTRIHGTTRKQVQQLFEQAEKPALQPLPASGGRFPFFHEGRRTVHRDGHVEVEKAYYSVPPEYMGRQVWARWDGRTVRVFNGRMEQIAYHVRKEPGRFSTQDRHIASAKINGVEQGAAKLLERVRVIGPQAGRWSEAMLQARGIAGVRVLMGLLSLSNKHAFETVDRACGVAASHGAYRLRSIRTLIARTAPAQEELPFIDEHPIIRSLNDYGDLVKTSFQTTPSITNKEQYA